MPSEQQSYRIFLVEDEPRLASYLANHLHKQGFTVHVASRFDDLKNELRQVDADLVLLDINLPWYDGFYWCRQFRTVTTAPIIFASARAGELDQVRAVENGGDDYVVKPFNLEVMTAKIRANLRRAYGEYAGTPQQQLLTHAGLSLDTERLLVAAGGQQVDLSRTESQLLAALIRAEGRVVPREELLAALWDETDFVDDNTLTVNVTRLRKKLAGLGHDGAIRTVRGSGYGLGRQDS